MDTFFSLLVHPFELQEWRHILIKISLTVVLAGLLGLERENRGRPAGLRTHILVCLGATLLMMVSEFIAMEFNSSGAQTWLDRGRIAAGIVTGVGFLGAGTIVRTGFQQTGLTTAAMVWFAACLGVAIGSGYYLVSIVSTLVVLVVVRGLGVFEHSLSSRDHLFLMVDVPLTESDPERLRSILISAGCALAQLRRVRMKPQEGRSILEFQVDLNRQKDFQKIFSAVSEQYSSARIVELRR